MWDVTSVTQAPTSQFRQDLNMMKLASLFTAYALAAAVSMTISSVAAGCCADCLGQSDPKGRPITYDPVVHLQCSAAVGICCYGCSFSHGNPSFESGATFASDGSVQTTVGTRVLLSFKGVRRLTYDFLALNQVKRTFVGNVSKEAATNEDGEFVLCARTPGTIAFRGWGADSCKQVTEEYTLTVAEGDGTATCDAGTVKPATTKPSEPVVPATTKPSEPVVPATTKPSEPVVPHGESSNRGENDVENCSATRGAVKQRDDGRQYCECLGDWRNPPMCDQYTWTKTIITILGAVAAVLSIAFSVRAYLKSKKAEKEANEDKELDVLSDHEIETLRISPAKNQRDSGSTVGTSAPSPATTVRISSTKRSPVRTPLTTTSRHETML